MDDPCVKNVLYDPADEPDLLVITRDENVPVIPVYTANPFYFASYLQPDEKLQPEIVPERVPLPKGAGGADLVPPLLDFQIVPVPGGLIFQGSPEDYQNFLRILEALGGNAAGAKVEIRLVPVRIGDPTQITGQLNILLNRVQFDSNSTKISGTTGQGGGLARGGQARRGEAGPRPLRTASSSCPSRA